MKKRLQRVSVLIMVAVGLLAASCASDLSESGLSTVVIQASPPAGRALSGGWTMGEGTLPSFSSITVSIRGAGRDPVVGTFDDPSDMISLTVRPGSGLSVFVSATPDWAATAVRYPDAQLPVLVNGYTGGAVVDAPAGSTVAATVYLAPANTRIPVPNPNGNWQLGVADSLYSQSLETHNLVDLTSASRFAFDKSGLLYVSMYGNVGIFGADLETPYTNVQFENDVLDFALCSATNRVYSVYSGGLDNYGVRFVDLDDAEPSALNASAMDAYQIQQGLIAVDGLGYLYAMAYENATEREGLLRFSIDGTSTAAPVAFASLEELGLGYWYDGGDAGMVFSSLTIEDMTIANGALYIALSDLNTQASISGGTLAGAAVCRGKIVALGLNPLRYLWETGWRDELDRRPESPDAPGLFAPRRFLAVAPKRLYLLDEGFYVDVSKYSAETWYPFEDVDRIVAVDLDSGTLTFGASGMTDGLVNYDSDPYSTYANC